jgi:hypothetical protein
LVVEEQVKKRRDQSVGLATSKSLVEGESLDPLESQIRQRGGNKNAARVVARAAFI